MNGENLAAAEKEHLSQLIGAIERSVYFLHASARKLSWPLDGSLLESRKKDEALYETLSTINERFSKLQDILGAAMRHAGLLAGENPANFLKLLSHYEKMGIIDSLQDWQTLRAARNLAAHQYDIEYRGIAEHYNTLYELIPLLVRISARFVRSCAEQLDVGPADIDFQDEFDALAGKFLPHP